jgi:hypothetical protein
MRTSKTEKTVPNPLKGALCSYRINLISGEIGVSISNFTPELIRALNLHGLPFADREMELWMSDQRVQDKLDNNFGIAEVWKDMRYFAILLCFFFLWVWDAGFWCVDKNWLAQIVSYFTSSLCCNLPPRIGPFKTCPPDS